MGSKWRTEREDISICARGSNWVVIGVGIGILGAEDFNIKTLWLVVCVLTIG